MKIKQVYAIEGLDRLGKSTLIEGILNADGHYEVIHFSKPKILDVYARAMLRTEHSEKWGIPDKSFAAWHYQSQGFRNSMIMANSGARIIFDRWHIGEAVYSPMYRGYNGNYVFDYELNHDLQNHASLRLILLVENFDKSYHFVDDGQSLGPSENRMKEQKLFIEAFKKSNIVDKRIIEVTAPDGSFRSKESILFDALRD